MPTLYYRIDAAGVNILSPVADQVVTGLLDELDMTDVFKDSVYIEDSIRAYSQYDDGNGGLSLNKDRCDVAVNYIMDKSQVPWPVDTPYTTPAYGLRSTKKGNHSPVLMDHDSNILIEHYTSACGIEFAFTLKFQSFDNATRAFSTIQSKYKGGLIKSPFDISFSYPVSMSLITYLYAVYKAKTDYANKTLFDYINDKKVSEISFDFRKSQLDEKDADRSLMVRCQQLNCIAQLTMEQKEPEVERANQLPDSFSLNFTLQFQFGLPDNIAVHTPVSVDNTLLPLPFFSNLNITHHYNPDVAGMDQDLNLNEYIRTSYGDLNAAGKIIHIPSYDDWFTYDALYSFYEYQPLIIAHFILDGPVTTIDLKQLDDVVLHPVVKAIMKAAGQDIFDYGGLFHVGVYANTLKLGREIISIDENLIMTIRSNRMDKEYHLIISETTALEKTRVMWDPYIIKYRYFFPMTINRNIQHLINKKYFVIKYDDRILNLIGTLAGSGRLRPILVKLVDDGEATNEIFGCTQNANQLADYLVYSQSLMENYTLPKVDPSDPDSPPIPIIETFYRDIASVEGRSLFIAFIEQCLIRDYIGLDEIPEQYLRPNTEVYPRMKVSGGYYGINTPFRVLNYNLRTK